MFVVALSCLAGGCAQTHPRPQWVYFPLQPDPARVVHLVSVNGPEELAPRTRRWSDFFHGRVFSPQLATPMGLAWHRDSLYVCDSSAGCVHVWNLATGAASRLEVAGGRSQPVAVAVDGEGQAYVADVGRGEVLCYDAAGKLRRRLKHTGRSGYRPAGVALWGSQVYVSDMAGRCVDVYATSSGDWLASLGSEVAGYSSLQYPRGLEVSPAGEIYVADMITGRLEVLDAAGKHLRSIGSPGSRPGVWGRPRDVAVAPDGTILVADGDLGAIHLLNPAGQKLLTIGGVHAGPGGTPLPNGIAVASLIPARLAEVVPPGFVADYYLWVSNTVHPHRLALFAVGAFESR